MIGRSLAKFQTSVQKGIEMATGKEIQAWCDDAMFSAQSIDREAGPQVFLLSCNPDPLGSIAACAKAYEGQFVESLSQITDKERKYYLREVQKSVLVMPLETVQFHFRISGVTRGFTHQMVRQRSAAYAQESTRFAVKEDVPVGRPPSLDGTIRQDQHWMRSAKDLYPAMTPGGAGWNDAHTNAVDQFNARNKSKEQIWRERWDSLVAEIDETYNDLVNSGMPAEDARGLLPTNLLTQINYVTDLRGLKEHAGLRLCTQAQFEWRLVWAQMIQAIRDYGASQTYSATLTQQDVDQMLGCNEVGDVYGNLSSQWQFDALAEIFKPICYYRGSCQFMAEIDRKCTIRDRVNANAAANVPSSEWEINKGLGYIQPISPSEWMADAKAAR